MKADIEDEMINLRDPACIEARRPLLVAHRGGVIAPNAPENSLGAIQLAAVHGYDMVELDVKQAKDEEPVLFHGLGGSGILTVDCGVNEFIENLTSDELTKITYLASTEHIATLAQALALCRQLNLGVMLDIKAAIPSVAFLHRISVLLEEHQLTSSAVTISHHPLVREHLADKLMFTVSGQDFDRVCRGETVSLHGQFWFAEAGKLPTEAVAPLQRNGALVIPALNTFRYPAHAHYVLARQDARRLLAAGVDGFQIDSVYEEFFL